MPTYVYAELAGLWIEAGGNGQDAAVAAAIAEAESGGDPTTINNSAYPNLPGYHTPAPGAQKEYSVGLWQINLLAHPQYTTAQMLDPVLNAKAAVTISHDGADFSPWSTYTSGAYKKYVLTNFVPTIPGPGGQVGPSGSLSGTGPATSTHQVDQAWAHLMRTLAITVPRHIDRVAAARARIRNAVR